MYVCMHVSILCMHYSASALGRTVSNYKLGPYLVMIIIITIIIIMIISNGTTTEWSTIQGVIGRVISNLTNVQREADLKLRARLPLNSTTPTHITN